jgi:mono/diheme cytochrome c family protein
MSPRRVLRRSLLALLALVLLCAAAVAAYVGVQVSSFDQSMRRTYDVEERAVVRSDDPAVLARGRQLVQSVGECSASSCHGGNLAGGKTTDMGPVGKITAPNITGDVLAAYSDGDLARLISRGIKRDGHSVVFMTVEDFDWLPPSDVDAMISYLRTVPKVTRPNGPTSISWLGKVLDRRGTLPLDVARRIDRAAPADTPPQGGPTAAYGAFLARACQGCHGEHLSGGPIPGAPSSMAIPANLTPDATGLRGWSFDDFEHTLETGVNKDGRHLDPLMPYDSYAQYDDTQKRALWAYLQQLPATQFGSR